MRILADVHISPRTVGHLRTLGHDVVRVGASLPLTASDAEIVAEAARDGRVVLTQDLDFTALVAVSGASGPSIISVRLSTARVEHVNARLERVMPAIEADLAAGALVTVEEDRVRIRRLPLP